MYFLFDMNVYKPLKGCIINPNMKEVESIHFSQPLIYNRNS